MPALGLFALLEELPVAAYLVQRDGQFITGNSKLAELLRIPHSTIPQNSISNFYSRDEERRALLDAVDRGETLEKRHVKFFVDNRDIEVQMSCRAVRDDHGAFVGYLGVLVEITAESEYHNLFDTHLPTGVYRLAADDTVTQANVAFARMHGYESVNDVKGKDVHQFYANREDADLIRARHVKGDSLQNERVELKRKNGEVFTAHLTTIPYFTRHNEYDGRGGFVREHDQIFDVPVGFYSVEHRDGKDIIVDCNEEYARIHEVDSREAMLGVNILDFHESPEATERYREKLRAAASSGIPVLGYHLRIKTRKRTIKTIEINSRPQVRAGRTVGRTGVVRDISTEIEMRELIDTLRENFGAVLHIFRQTLSQLSLSILAVADALAHKPKTINRSQTPDELAAAIRRRLTELTVAIDDFVTKAIASRDTSPLSATDLTRLTHLRDLMVRCCDERPPAHWRDLWRSSAVEIQAICSRVTPGVVAKSSYRDVARAAESIAGITALATLAIAREAIMSVDAPVNSLSKYVATGKRHIEPAQVVPIEECVAGAIATLTGFADERRVNIQFDPTTTTEVRVARSEITRAIVNLLHNAIKYSWQREDGRTWVTVAVSTRDDTVVVTVQNWGVPVPQEEIKNDLVFRLGFRGRLSSDRGRMGSGIGMTDSLAVAKANHGRLRIESRPATMTGPKNYHHPFLTTTYLELPVVRERK